MISNLEEKPLSEVMGMLERLAKKHDLLLSLRQIATKGESK